MIRENEVLEVINDKLEADGLSVGSRVVVVSVKAVPLSEEDPYTQRIKFFVAKLKEDETGIEEQLFVIDPTSVKSTGLIAVADAD